MPSDILHCTAAYMHKALGVPEGDIQKVCLEYYTKYGTTMAGLVVSCSTFILDIPVANFSGLITHTALC